MLSRYKSSFSACRQQTDNEKDPTICQPICHNDNDPHLYSLGTSLESRPLHRVSEQIFPYIFHSGQANADMVPRLDHDHFLPNLLYFINRPLVPSW
jgi:hypothetical protein